jgi:hypothetical protein
MQWVRQQRLDRALDRLQNPLQGESVLGVALACGYRSLSQFSVDFQRAYQRKPSEVLRLGRAMAAIRDDELAAASVGIDTPRTKLIAFVASAVLAGVTGALAAHFFNSWNARAGSFDASITTLAFVVFGGSRFWLGPVLGGLALTALPELLRPVGDLRLILFGAVILLAMQLPKGAVPYLLIPVHFLKLLVGYLLLTWQSRAFQLHEHFGGEIRNGLYLMLASTFLRTSVLSALESVTVSLALAAM